MNANLPPSMDLGSENGAQTNVGSLLRASRLRRNEELSDIAKTLRIRQVYMEAIEDCRYDDLPGTIYAVGFIRAYAELMGLDGEEVVRRFKVEVEKTEIRSNLTFPILIPEHSVPSNSIIMVGLLIAIIGYGIWYLDFTKDILVSEEVPPVPEKLAPLAAADNDAGANAGNTLPEPVLQPADPTTDRSGPSDQTTDLASTPAAVNKPSLFVETTETVAAPSPASTDSPAVLSTQHPVTSSAPESALESAPGTATDAVHDVASNTEGETVASSLRPDITDPEPASDPMAGDAQNITKPTHDAAAPRQPASDNSADQTTASTEVAKPAESKSKTPPTAEEIAAALAENEPAPKTPASETATPAVSNEQAPAEETASTTVSRITLRAKNDSYIQVRDSAANQLILTKLLKQGDSYDVPNRSGLALLTGNAGALEILVDGEPVPAIGPVGAVRRNVVLEAAKLRDGTAASE